MLKKIWGITLVVLMSAALGVSSVSAAGHGSKGSRSFGAAAGFRPVNGNYPANSERFLRAENGIYGPAWGFGNTWGYGGAGYGWGCGYGFPGWGYSPWVLGWDESVPYFSLFPPIYYEYVDNMPVVKAPIRSSWAGGVNAQPVIEPTTSPNPTRPPLRIINPYYVEAKADKP